MTRISLTEAARDWIRERGGAVTLRVSPRHGCCGGQAGLPVAEPGAPEARQDYAARRIDDIEVFHDRSLGPGPYRVDLVGLWRWQRLSVEGDIGGRTDGANRAGR